jgi:hypothetical protein
MKKIVFFFLTLLPAVALAEAGKATENTVVFLTLKTQRTLGKKFKNRNTHQFKKKAFDLEKWDIREGQLVQAFYAAEKGDPTV